eukprot:gene9980-20755_t
MFYSALNIVVFLILVVNNVLSYTSSKHNNPRLRAPMLMTASLGRDSIPQIFACPESLEPLGITTKYYGCITEKTLRKVFSRYASTGTYFDLTIPEEVERPLWQLNIREIIGQNFFQNPLISGIYERGYRQNFERAGFPGIEKEFLEVDEFFKSANASTIFDLSCGPGFMARNLVKSANYNRVIAGDLSPTMLGETRQRFINENLPVPELIRCDSAKLPFVSESVDAVHAGAAMHCWPRLSQALREAHRILKPGGVFYASTFFLTVPMNKFQRENSGFYYFESENEIRDFLVKAGFEGDSGAVVVRKEGRGCAIIKAVKGPVPDGLGKYFDTQKTN